MDSGSHVQNTKITNKMFVINKMSKINIVKIDVDSEGITVNIEGHGLLRLKKKIRDVKAYDPTQDKLLIELIGGILGKESGTLVPLDSWTEGGAN